MYCPDLEDMHQIQDFYFDVIDFFLSKDKKLLIPLWCQIKQNLCCCSQLLKEYSASSVNVVSCNPCIGTLHRKYYEVHILQSPLL